MNNKITSSLSLLAFLVLASSCTGVLPESQIKFGVEAAQHGLWDEAVFRWEKAVQANPNSAAAHNNLAVAYERKGCFKKAEAEYKKALELSPKNKQIQSNYQNFKEKLEKIGKEEEKHEKK